MSEYTDGAHDAIDAMIVMFRRIKQAPILGAARYMTKVHEVAGEPYISIDNVIELLQHHRDGQVKMLEQQHKTLDIR